LECVGSFVTIELYFDFSWNSFCRCPQGDRAEKLQRPTPASAEQTSSWSTRNRGWISSIIRFSESEIITRGLANKIVTNIKSHLSRYPDILMRKENLSW